MRARLSLMGIAVGLAILCASLDRATQVRPGGEIAFEPQDQFDDFLRPQGNPRSGEVNVSLEFRDRPYVLGEPIRVEYHVENRGGSPIEFLWGPEIRGMSVFEVSAVDSQGRPCIDPRPKVMYIGAVLPYSLASGKGDTFTVDLLHYVRFERAGRYRATIRIHPGWSTSGLKTDPRQLEVVVDVVEPTREQARALVDGAVRYLESGPPWPTTAGVVHDWKCLSYPIYLPLLMQHADHHLPNVLAGLGQMPLPEATDAMLRLAEGAPASVGLSVLKELQNRLPLPGFNNEFHPWSYHTAWLGENQRRLWNSGWRPDFAPRVRQLARVMLARNDPESVEYGAKTVARVGLPEDMPHVIRAFDRLIADAEGVQRVPPRYPLGVPGQRLGDAVEELLRAHARVPEDSRTPGEAVTWSIAARMPRGRELPNQAAVRQRLFQHPSAYVRERAMALTNRPVADGLYPLALAALDDGSVDVRIAASDLIGRARWQAARESLLTLARTTNDRDTFAHAESAAMALGAALETFRICVDRIGDHDVAGACLDCLHRNLNGIHFKYLNEPSAEQRKASKLAWHLFLDRNADRIGRERTLPTDNLNELRKLFPGYAVDRARPGADRAWVVSWQ